MIEKTLKIELQFYGLELLLNGKYYLNT